MKKTDKNKFRAVKSGTLIMLSTMLLLSACKKSFLELPKEGEVQSSNFWTSAADADKAVSSIYSNLRSWDQVAFSPIAIESLGADDAEKGSDASDASFLNMYDNFSVTSTQDQLGNFWNGMYKEINLCNQVLDHIDTMGSVATAMKTRYKAEAKFVRAYMYFRLVRAFGGVPLRLHVPLDQNEYNIPRASADDVWNAIEADLNDAAAALPVAYSAGDIGRITKGGALSLHAKVAMYRKNWADVKSYTDQVIALGVYSLYPNYEKMFRVENENCSESIFEIQCALITGNGGASNCQYSQVQGIRGTVSGWGFNIPTTSLVNEFESGDPRLNATVIFRGTTTVEGDAVPSTVPNPMYNYKSYVPFSQIITGYTEGCQQNVRVIRYADVLLMNAEANNELGNTTPALAALELVRARARAGNSGILPAVTTTDKTALRNAIWHERRVELAMEFDRYFDVIRQGRAATVFGPKGWQANKNEVWPIPQTEIDLSNNVLTQNPGY